MAVLSLSPTDWVHRPHQVPQAGLRLFCLPYAGGDASLFQEWPMALPFDMRDCIEICPLQLPGRAHRVQERPLCTSLSALIELLVPSSLQTSPLYPYLDKPFAFFGASTFGGFICFELARALQLRHGREAVALCVASCRAPHLPGPHVLDESTQFNNKEQLRQVQLYSKVSASMFDKRMVMQLTNPYLGTDALMTATYSYIPDLSLDCPITVIGGSDDATASSDDLIEWRVHTRRSFHLYILPGNHFFVRDAPDAVRWQLLEYICHTIRQQIGWWETDQGKTGRRVLFQEAQECT